MMGYIKDMYGDRNHDFIRGFISAIDTFAVHKDGQRWIGSPESEARSTMEHAITELGDDPRAYFPAPPEEG
jgi:hypothetical protein